MWALLPSSLLWVNDWLLWPVLFQPPAGVACPVSPWPALYRSLAAVARLVSPLQEEGEESKKGVSMPRDPPCFTNVG